MPYKVRPLKRFDREFKRLRKKYSSFFEDVIPYIEALSITPTLGESIGKNCYKIRVPISSKGKGKSGGARLITCVYFVQETVFLLSIYDKSEQDSISNKEIEALLRSLEDNQ